MISISCTVKLSNLMRTKSNRNEINRIETKTRKNFLMLKVLELSELLEPNRIEINRIESKRNQSNRIESKSEYALNSRVSREYDLYIYNSL
jgi:hypothetical protein